MSCDMFCENTYCEEDGNNNTEFGEYLLRGGNLIFGDVSIANYKNPVTLQIKPHRLTPEILYKQTLTPPW